MKITIEDFKESNENKRKKKRKPLATKTNQRKLPDTIMKEAFRSSIVRWKSVAFVRIHWQANNVVDSDVFALKTTKSQWANIEKKKKKKETKTKQKRTEMKSKERKKHYKNKQTTKPKTYFDNVSNKCRDWRKNNCARKANCQIAARDPRKEKRSRQKRHKVVRSSRCHGSSGFFADTVAGKKVPQSQAEAGKKCAKNRRSHQKHVRAANNADKHA